MSLSKNEEDYLKALFYIIVENENENAGTNQLAEYLQISPASVNAMLKKLKQKGYVSYKKYGKLKLTLEGKSIAVTMMRKHRLWETFLNRYMNFSWEEVHDVAEQLEHIKSDKLISELDKFLGFPKSDPHGAVIPDASGNYERQKKVTLADLKTGDECRLVSVKDSSATFLKYVSQIGLALSSKIAVIEIREFDGSLVIKAGKKRETVSNKFAQNVFVEKLN